VSAALAAIVALSALAMAAESLPQAFRISVDGGADALGQVVFSFAEDDAEAVQISVSIPKGTPENDVARRIRKELRRALPKEGYGVDLDDGEKVVVSARDTTRNFDLRLERNTATGTEISIARE
jgi:RNase P protein component